ncbi:hypothetical protein [Vibrio ostreicida]|uniref:hypothetical protein n=1 Tax=Vibrio ostreicida TaxID=526588 RepID=UPI0009708FEA|nr:hypothetical protein [Vibrio ostreicida]
MILSSKRLSSHEDLLEFAKQYKLISGNNNSVELLRKRSFVGAFYNAKGKMCAGFTINSDSPLTYLHDLPKDLIHPLTHADKEIVEGGGLWVNPELSDFERGYVFIKASWQAYRTKKKYFMAGAKNPKVASRQKFIYPKILFEGATEQFDYLCILYCRRHYILIQIALFFLRYWITQPLKKWLRGARQATT